MKKLMLTILINLSFVTTIYSQWIPQYYDSLNFYPYDIRFVSPQTGWMAGASYSSSSLIRGQVYKTYNGGYNWVYQFIPVTKRLFRIEIVNSNVIYISGDSNTVLKTTNGGSYWVRLNTPVISSLRYNWKLCFISSDTGFISTDQTNASNKTYLTTDGGSIWNSVSSIGFGIFKFFDINTGYGVNGNGIFKTTNGGINWNNQISDSLINEMYFIDRNTGWCFSRSSNFNPGIKGKGYKSTNGGDNWILLYSTDTSIFGLYSVKFFDQNTGYAEGFNSPTNIIKTTNSGATWFNPTNNRLYSYSMYFYNNQTGWTSAFGQENYYGYLLFKTTNGPGNSHNPFFASLVKRQNSNNIDNNMKSDGSISERDDIDPNKLGLEWPKGSGKYLIFSSGIAIGAMINGQLRVSSAFEASYNSCFSPGEIDSNGNEIGHNLGEYGFLPDFIRPGTRLSGLG